MRLSYIRGGVFMKKQIVAVILIVAMFMSHISVYADSFSQKNTKIVYDADIVNRDVGNWEYVSGISQFVDNENNYCFAYNKGKYVYIVKTEDGVVKKKIKIKKKTSIFGAVACDQWGNYYVVTGKSNKTKDETKNTIYVSKYSAKGEYIDSVGDNGGASVGSDSSEWYTKYPFWGGNCDIAINGDLLTVYYARKMYNGHQSDSLFTVNVNKMKKLYLGECYHSHSFAQRAVPYNNGFLLASEGDGHPRAFSIDVMDTCLDTNFCQSVFHFWVKKGTLEKYDMSLLNDTFSHMGDVAVASGTSVALVGTSVKSLNKNATKEAENLFIQIFDPYKDLATEEAYATKGMRTGLSGGNGDEEVTDYGVKWLTNEKYLLHGKQYRYPQVVATASGKYVVLFEQYKWNEDFDGVYYIVVDKDGNVLKEKTKYSSRYVLNSCETPVCIGETVYWTTNKRGDNRDDLFVCKLTLDSNEPVVETTNKIALSKKRISLKKGSRATVNINCTGAYAFKKVKSVTYNKKNIAKATVKKNQITVKGKKLGTVKIAFQVVYQNKKSKKKKKLVLKVAVKKTTADEKDTPEPETTKQPEAIVEPEVAETSEATLKPGLYDGDNFTSWEQLITQINYRKAPGESSKSGGTDISVKNGVVKAWNAAKLKGRLVFPKDGTIVGIANNGFEGQDELTEIELSDGITGIGHHAFSGCSDLISVEIPDSTVNIYNSAFLDCSSLTKIKLSKNLKAINDSMFSGCSRLSSIEIPDSVTRIGKSAFSGCNSLTSIEISSKVTDIGVSVLSGCSVLGSINVDPQNANYTSGEQNNMLVCTKNNQFLAGCANASIPNTVTSINSGAFAGCKDLKNIEIPNSVSEIDSAAFAGCISLTSIEVPSGVAVIASKVFYNCTNLTNIKMHKDITSIGSYAFANCGSLTTLEIPSGVEDIGKYALSGCKSLEAIKIPKEVSCINDRVFYGCEGLCTVELPDQIESIGEYAFAKCGKLENIELPMDLLTIKECAFGWCEGLTSIELPCEVNSIENGIFYGCNSLVDVKVDPRNDTYDSRNNCNAIIEKKENQLIAGCATTVIPDNVTSIKERAFSNNDRITNVVLPNNLKEIEAYAFSECDNLVTIEFGEGVKNIGKCAFFECDGLLEIMIPGSVKKIGEKAFYKCKQLKSVKILSGMTSIDSYAFMECDNLESFVSLDNTTTIGSYAFSKCKNLKDITLLNGETSIGNNAFSQCSGLTEIKLDNGVTSIDDYAFSKCDGLTSVAISGNTTSIGDYAFSECGALKNLELGNGVTAIGKHSFSNCTEITSIVIPSSVTSISYSSFYGCSNITSISVDEKNPVYDSKNNCNAIIVTGSKTLLLGCATTKMPDDLTSIGLYAFAGCSKLESIVMPDNLTSIGSYAFYNCEGITRLTFPSSGVEVGDFTFAGCSKLESIVASKELPKLGNGAFSRCVALKEIYYYGTGNEYQWQRFLKKWKDKKDLSYKYLCNLEIYAWYDGWLEK